MLRRRQKMPVIKEDASLPLIRVSRTEQGAVVVVPGWSAASLSLIFRICAAAVEKTVQHGLSWVAPRVECGRRQTCVAAYLDAPDHLGFGVRGMWITNAVNSLARAAEEESQSQIFRHAAGPATHRVEVVR